MFFNFEIAYKCSVYGNNSKSYIKFVITFIIEKIYNLISNVLPNVEVAGNSFFGVGYLVYYIIICVAVFLLSGWMADKKLSV